MTVLAIIHLALFAIFAGGLVGARGTVKGLPWSLIVLAWVFSGLGLAIGALA